jgi:DnaJ-class molecular chaperone
MESKEFNPYIILEVNKNTSIEDIKKAYREKSKKLHPDHGGNPEEFNNLKKAFGILTNPDKKVFYDEYGLSDMFDIENEAKLVAVQIVVSMLEGLQESQDADIEIAKIFKKCLSEIKEQQIQQMKARDKLQRRLNAIQKKPVNDFLTNEIVKIIEAHHRAMKQAQLNYFIHDTAFKMIKEYQFDIVKLSFMGAEDINSNPSARSRAEALQRSRVPFLNNIEEW